MAQHDPFDGGNDGLGDLAREEKAACRPFFYDRGVPICFICGLFVRHRTETVQEAPTLVPRVHLPLASPSGIACGDPRDFSVFLPEDISHGLWAPGVPPYLLRCDPLSPSQELPAGIQEMFC